MSPEQVAELLLTIVVKLIGVEALKEKTAQVSQAAIDEANAVADALEDAKFPPSEDKNP